MIRKYYSSRTGLRIFTLSDLSFKVQNLYILFKDKDYFQHKAGITRTSFNDSILNEAALALSFQPFPITDWSDREMTEDQIFDTLEFLYDHVSKPGELGWMTDETGWRYEDYVSFDDKKGREEFMEKANIFLTDYKSGYELTKDGQILASGTDGLQHILDAEIIPFDEINVDSKVCNAIKKWRNRHLSLLERKEAIRELADVFEWLKKTKKLSKVLDSKDESAIFDIANNFGIRHHNPKQKTNYNPNIWYSWIFHFYLATYHAVIRLLINKANEKTNLSTDMNKL